MIEILLTVMPWLQIVLVILMTIGVLLQPSEAGLGSAFGGGESESGGGRVRRGPEKFIFNATLVVALVFVAVSIVAVVL